MPSCPPPSSPPLQQGFSFSFFIPGPVVKRLPRHDVWLSSSREVRGFIGRVKTKPLICIGISKAEEKPVSPDSMGRLRQCVCRVRVVSDSCSLVRISNMWCCMSKTSWPTAPNWSNKYSFYTFSQKKHTVITVLMCCHWGKSQTPQSHFKNCDHDQYDNTTLWLTVAHYNDA